MKKQRGFIQLAILHLLKEDSMHGYQIMKKLEENSDGLYTASAGTIYPALQELLDRNLVNLHVEGGKKVYSMNDNGKERLQQYELNREGGFWLKWREKLVWRNSKEALELKAVVEQWELELRKTVKLTRGNPELAVQLTSFLQEMTEKIKEINAR